MTTSRLISINVSPGGIPKAPVAAVAVDFAGLRGDGHNHEKHRRTDRAISIQDIERIDEIRAEGYGVAPGLMGENLTVKDLNVQGLQPGDRLAFSSGVVLELTSPRKPCFVLDQIDPNLKTAVVGRCGFLARVIQRGELRPGMAIQVVRGTPPLGSVMDAVRS